MELDFIDFLQLKNYDGRVLQKECTLQDLNVEETLI